MTCVKLFFSNGLLSTMETGIICDMTTGDPVITRQIANELPGGILCGCAGLRRSAQRPQDFSDNGGGSDNAVGQTMPALEAVSPNIFRTGVVGTGHVMKLANNMLNATNRYYL